MLANLALDLAPDHIVVISPVVSFVDSKVSLLISQLQGMI